MNSRPYKPAEDDPKLTTTHIVAGVNGDVERVLTRPIIHWARAILVMLATLAGAAGIGIAAYFITRIYGWNGEKYVFPPVASGFIGSGGSLAIVLFFTRKQICIWVIRLYQRYAKEDLRLRCLFTPSCSEYMAMAIHKYGVIRGIIKGKNRFDRCHMPNGGEDYP